jgi:Transposase IS116/IS110/IS902 family
VDLTRIDGVDVMVAQTVISEVGLDMSPWKTEAHFASWLGLCPDRSSKDSPLLKSNFVLHRCSPLRHEATLSNSNPSRVSARSVAS